MTTLQEEIARWSRGRRSGQGRGEGSTELRAAEPPSGTGAMRPGAASALAAAKKDLTPPARAARLADERRRLEQSILRSETDIE